ncbi:MAG TPA: transglutaminase domain-containing protein, partial [Leptospiraceae bacterium]|nr:transglutaminase domain-containing protein [Leptospiraceae bacterium]
VFCTHAVVLYLAAFPQKAGTGKKAFLYGGIAAGIVLLLAFVVPPDFVTHNVVLNELDREPPPNPSPLEGEPIDERDGEGRGQKQKEEENTRNGKPLGEREEKYPSELQGGHQGQGERDPKQGQKPGQGNQNKPQQERGGQGQQNQSQSDQGKGNQSKGQPKLEGLPADQWNNQQQSGAGQGKQSAVMVIASPVQPVYAAESYRGKFTTDHSFEPDPIDDDLNSLAQMRLMQTWRNSEEEADQYRRPVEIFYLSTIPGRVLAFRPLAIEPTIQDKRYSPFNLSYMALSRMNVTSPDEWISAGNLSPEEREQHSYYLAVPKDPRVDKIRARVKEITKDKNWHFEKIAAILRSYKNIQYEVGFDEDQNLDKISKFLFETRKGDCTEFSESAALMGRLAGIPSRVVVGYIASKDLQTPAHRGGIYHIRRRVPVLQKYKMDELYLVTTSHHHAWVQFYLPRYGWVVFETTSFAIPPQPKMDPNNQDVLIPLIEEVPQVREQKFKFPYYFAGRVLAILTASILAALYLYRFFRLMYLKAVARSMTTRGLDALFRVIIIRMAREGYDVRPPFLTHAEYARIYPQLGAFAAVFTALRFREHYDEESKIRDWNVLRAESADVMKRIRKPGAWAGIRRLLTLNGIWI